MDRIERRKQIIDVLKNKKQLSLKEYFLFTSEAGIVNITARRDLAFFEQKGLISLETGLIHYVGTNKAEQDRQEQINLNSFSKNKIAQYAASLLKTEDVIYVDPGTTNEFLVKNIKTPIKLLITNGLHIFNQARKNPKIKQIILIGGDFRTNTGSFVGQYAIKMLQELPRFDKGFFTANSVDENLDFYNNNQLEGEVYQMALQKSQQAIALIDGNKFKIKGDYYLVANIDAFKVFITSTQAPNKIINKVSLQKLKVV
ncbi:DeoR/GlpR family DNA-binding transcription regulator [Williamsoniiplasma lucivorax]|uniref:DeoR family transcriptional regulator, lactose phosphotransferase system repressor n=1 Tax=Williamsoniiplasma lucivorax TaxID=209274 RepID=A0A2S5REJ3_9MOLU|nr:DeoR/GlpR family DNA-binding transcription regulator [Williamsoniiplasma lucivorax]PPE05749.1 DeoR family transcriptional regulator, lactose phosphotransferase system repressor [Williamsoniiplasma lucivorax]